ncbi:MAG: circularly permuted type 2 ATP-grasp protein [Alphaproteobacteria bacterium]|nr:circularly permuted type 2 ATP-grasp protein [Alphaproteobacteria bacterium]
MTFGYYQTEYFFDELFERTGEPRPHTASFIESLEGISYPDLQAIQRAAEASLYKLGITFNVYGNKDGREKIFPFDIIPRIIDATEWNYLEYGLKQRIKALNLFIDDIYHNQHIIKDKKIPREIVETCPGYYPQCANHRPAKGIWSHISGMDLVRDKDGTYYVLEDNLRCPSGVSYVLENRQVMKQTFPGAFKDLTVRPVEEYPQWLYDMLAWVSPEQSHNPTIVLLTPGMYNSAYFEHAYLAQKMGIPLVEGRDLMVTEDKVFMKTTSGLKRVDVIYRRVDENYLDPLVFKKDSVLGIPGIIRAFQKGNVSLVNAPGTGVADDKAIYHFVETMIRYYLNEEPVLANVPTYLCTNETERKHVIQNIDQMVVKPTNESGGYGVIIGPSASPEEKASCITAIQNNPRNYIAQPVISLSRVPVLSEKGYHGRHVDLRPYILYGEDIRVLPGGLTRVALKEGSLIVNSSQGGGSKDTWVLADNGGYHA